MEDDELLKDYRQSLRETIEFYSNSNKAARDLWVIRHFLSYLGITYQTHELISCVPDPPDVRFRHNDYEVKEILDEDRKRHSEYRQKLAAAEQATRYSELLEGYTPGDLSISLIADLV